VRRPRRPRKIVAALRRGNATIALPCRGWRGYMPAITGWLLAVAFQNCKPAAALHLDTVPVISWLGATAGTPMRAPARRSTAKIDERAWLKYVGGTSSDGDAWRRGGVVRSGVKSNEAWRTRYLCACNRYHACGGALAYRCWLAVRLRLSTMPYRTSWRLARRTAVWTAWLRTVLRRDTA